MNIIKLYRADAALEPFEPTQPDLFGVAVGAVRFAIDVPTEVTTALGAGAPVFIGVSGGRDSQALAYRVGAHLDDIEHPGPRFLVHADLGRVDWREWACGQRRRGRLR